jgi:hypothetical protein
MNKKIYCNFYLFTKIGKYNVELNSCEVIDQLDDTITCDTPGLNLIACLEIRTPNQ